MIIDRKNVEDTFKKYTDILGDFIDRVRTGGFEFG